MTHVLDEPIEAAEEAIRESFITRHGYDWPDWGAPKTEKQRNRDSLRSMVAALRILRAERECPREENTYRAVMASAERDRLKDKADELRAEREGGRKKPSKNGHNQYLFDRYIGRRRMAQGGRVWADDEADAYRRVRVLFFDDHGRADYVLVAERDGPRDDHLRAEGRREERERVDVLLEFMVPGEDRSSDYIVGHIDATEEARLRIREGDHWKDGGE